jgi:arylsulfatase A-like enzyme
VRIAAVLAALPLAAGACARGESRGLRVVLVTLDTLRYDAVFGDAPAMPRLAARARTATVFSRFYSAASSTQPSHASMFTGLHPWQHGVARNGAVLPERFVTLAEALRAAGFETRAVVASFPVAGRFGFAQGFDSYHDRFTLEHAEGARRRWEKEWEVPEGGFFSAADTVTGLALEAIDAAASERQFFWFHYFDPHAPYGLSRGEALDKRSILRAVERGEASLDEMLARARALYAADAESLDASLERVLERLDADADAFETHVLIVSDHGESLGEEGWLGHGWRTSEEEIHVPAVLLSPRVAPGVRADVAGSVDVAATLLSLAGASTPPMAGRDLSRPSPDGAQAVGMRRPARDEGQTLRLLDRSVTLARHGFFRVDAQGRIAAGDSRAASGEDAARVRALFADFERELEGSQVEAEVDPETRRALEALGYAP